MKKRIILVRHGRQNSSKCNVDVALSPEGILQAELLAKRLEGIQIVLVNKGSSPPGAVSGSYIYKGASNSIIRNDNTKIVNNKVYVNGVSNSIALKYNAAYTYLDNLENEILVNINISSFYNYNVR